MTAVPVRIPEAWSAAWFRQFYAEVLALQVGSGEVTDAELSAAVVAHNADPIAHGGIPPAVDTAAIEIHSFFLGT